MSKKYLIPYIVSLVAAVVVGGGGVYFWQQNVIRKLEIIDCGPTSTIIEPTIVQKEALPTVSINSLLMIEDLFKAIGEGNIVYNGKLDEVDIYHSGNVDLSKIITDLSKPITLRVNVYKYELGDKFKSAYEGSEWIVDLDNWKKWLNSLKVGKNEVEAQCSDWGCNILENPQTVVAKKFNGNKYYVGDGYFKPAGTLTRDYTSYNVKAGAIVDISISYYAEKGSEEMSTVSAIFSRIEKILP
ncbi:MAG: hypothetical protein WC596_03855 [Candidatus Shapirobacteria bacterium]